MPDGRFSRFRLNQSTLRRPFALVSIEKVVIVTESCEVTVRLMPVDTYNQNRHESTHHDGNKNEEGKQGREGDSRDVR